MNHFVFEFVIVSREVNVWTSRDEKRIVVAEWKTRQRIRRSRRNNPRSQRQFHALNHAQLRMHHHVSEILSGCAEKSQTIHADRVRI